MRKFYVYAYVVNDVPFYIGKGHGNRSREHLNAQLIKRHDYFHNVLRSYIQRKIEVEIIHILENLTESEAFTWKRGLIANFGRRDLGTGILTNMTDGGEGSANGSAQRKCMLTQLSDPKFRAKRLRCLKIKHTDPVFAAANIKRLKARHTDPIFAEAHSKRLRIRSRIRFANNRVYAFDQFWYVVDLANKFDINKNTLYRSIKNGIAPAWACLFKPGSGHRYPDYCKPTKIEKVFGSILQVNSEAIHWLYFSENLKD